MVLTRIYNLAGKFVGFLGEQREECVLTLAGLAEVNCVSVSKESYGALATSRRLEVSSPASRCINPTIHNVATERAF